MPRQLKELKKIRSQTFLILLIGNGKYLSSWLPVIFKSVAIFTFCSTFLFFRELICCGVIYRGLFGEVMVDPRLYKRCPLMTHGRVKEDPTPLTVESLIESELKKFAENNTVVKVKDIDSDSELRVGSTENDEGFCDKASTITGPSSPDSCRLVLEED